MKSHRKKRRGSTGVGSMQCQELTIPEMEDGLIDQIQFKQVFEEESQAAAALSHYAQEPLIVCVDRTEVYWAY